MNFSEAHGLLKQKIWARTHRNFWNILLCRDTVGQQMQPLCGDPVPNILQMLSAVWWPPDLTPARPCTEWDTESVHGTCFSLVFYSLTTLHFTSTVPLSQYTLQRWKSIALAESFLETLWCVFLQTTADTLIQEDCKDYIIPSVVRDYFYIMYVHVNTGMLFAIYSVCVCLLNSQ